jgi:hypothetical protein
LIFHYISDKNKKLSCQIFISLRFAEAGIEANALKTALEARGIFTFLCAVHPGGDIRGEIVNALSSSQLAIIMPDDLVTKILEKLASTTVSTNSVGSELNEKLPSPLPSSATIPVESLNPNESIELLIHLGCSAELRKKVKELNLEIDGGYLQYLHEIEVLQELEGVKNNLRIPVLKRILNKLKKFQENGIPSGVLNEVKNNEYSTTLSELKSLIVQLKEDLWDKQEELSFVRMQLEVCCFLPFLVAVSNFLFSSFPAQRKASYTRQLEADLRLWSKYPTHGSPGSAILFLSLGRYYHPQRAKS